jgi:hypothetical protein
MKISIDIDCTPQEARTFLGLPDVAPMQESLMAMVQDRMEKNLSAMDAEALMKTWLPASAQGWDTMQKMFWSAMSGGSKGKESKEE